MCRHYAVADIGGQHDAHWKNGSKGWRRDDVILKSICTDLDHGEIDIPRGWKAGTTRSLNSVKVEGWGDALKLGFKKLVTDQITYSLGMVLRNGPQSHEGLRPP